jgi:exonuclease III
MRLRVVSWNINGRGSASWDYLETALRPDVALLQEAVPPAGVPNVLWQPIPHRRFGSAVVTYGDLSLSPVHGVPLANATETDLPESHPGAFRVAEVGFPGMAPVTVISLYGCMPRVMNGTAYATTTLHRSLSDLTPILDTRAIGRRRVVIAGDLNATPQFSDRYYAAQQALVIDRLTAFGLTCCLGTPPDRCVTTFRRARGAVTVEYQDDWMFASRNLRLMSCEAVDEAIDAYSDHAPIVAEFEVDRATPSNAY